MSLTCPGVCRIAGENCQGFLSYQCHRSDDITIANFILQFISSCCVFVSACTAVCTCASGCVNMWQREKQARSLCNSVCEGTNTHLYDNFLFTMSKDSNTDTIHFPFINWCGNVGPRGSDFWSLSGLRAGRVCFTGGRRKLLVQGRWFWDPRIHNIAFAREKMLSFYEYLAAIARDCRS